MALCYNHDETVRIGSRLMKGDQSSLGAEFLTRVMAFVDGKDSLEYLEDWVAGYAPELATSDLPEVKMLHSRLWRMIGERGRGHRSIDSMRHDLISGLTHAALSPTES